MSAIWPGVFLVGMFSRYERLQKGHIESFEFYDECGNRSRADRKTQTDHGSPNWEYLQHRFREYSWYLFWAYREQRISVRYPSSRCWEYFGKHSYYSELILG